MKKIFFIVLVLVGFVIYWSGCEDAFGPQPTVTVPETGVHARIGVNDNPAATTWDSVRTNRLVRISSVFSTGNIVRREWKVYRWRTGQFIEFDTATILERTYTSQDTLIYKLKVFGTLPSDTNSTQLNLRILNYFGGPTGNDIYLLSYVPSGTNNGTYYIVLPYGRISLSPPWNSPRLTGSHIGFTNYEQLVDSLPGVGWIWHHEATSYDQVEWNYLVNNSQFSNVWSNATGSAFKTPGSANTYTTRFIGPAIYPSGGGPVFIIPGNVGDTVARYAATPTALIIYPFHPWIQSPIGQTWNEVNVYNFARHNHSNYSQNNNYGIVSVPIDSIQAYGNQVGFSFGGQSGVADLTHSPQYDPPTGRIWFQFIGPTNPPPKVGEKIQLKFRNGFIQEIIVQPEETL